MGTHPIFESDFDCLTDLLKNVDLSKPSFGLQKDIKNIPRADI